MKLAIVGIVLFALAGVGYYYMEMNAPAVAPATDVDQTMEEMDMEMEVDSNNQPMIDDSDFEGVPMTEEEMKEIEASVTAPPVNTAPPESAATAKVFTVTGSNFAFNRNEIRVKEGDTVTINFESTSGLHDWVVDEFAAATAKVQPGTPTSVTFVADKKGTFEYYCSVGSHRAQGMVGNLIVE